MAWVKRAPLALARGAPELLNRALPTAFTLALTPSAGRLTQAAISADATPPRQRRESHRNRGCATAPPPSMNLRRSTVRQRHRRVRTSVPSPSSPRSRSSASSDGNPAHFCSSLRFLTSHSITAAASLPASYAKKCVCACVCVRVCVRSPFGSSSSPAVRSRSGRSRHYGIWPRHGDGPLPLGHRPTAWRSSSSAHTRRTGSRGCGGRCPTGSTGSRLY